MGKQFLGKIAGVGYAKVGNGRQSVTKRGHERAIPDNKGSEVRQSRCQADDHLGEEER
jgi:hypothetical protein